MNKTLLVLFITFSFAKCLGQDYINNNLNCVYGKRNYHGSDDIQASVRVTSHDNIIEVLVDIKDDKVFFNNELVKSDHIELWFAIDTLSRNYILWNDNIYDSDSFVGAPVSIEDFLVYKADQQQTQEGSEAEPKLINDFTGMVHWGIDLKNK